MATLFAYGLGLASTNTKGEWLETFYPSPEVHCDASTAALITKSLQLADIDYATDSNTAIELDADQMKKLSSALDNNGLKSQAKIVEQLASSKKVKILTLLATDDKPKSVPEAYLKLQLLSHRLAKPHEINLDGIFASLPNLAWTNKGPIDLNELNEALLAARINGDWLNVKCVDKFPPMSDYVVPNGVRIAHTARVRLGAYVGEGTTIMHEGFINFNAGTAGKSMIEGRISAGVFINEGSDLGGGSSTMGTLSGGGNVIISVGKNCLIGANAGIGIALGDRCTVEAGLYITAGTKVAVLDESNNLVEVIKARELNGKSDLVFRRNSQTGAVECKTNKSVIELNDMLHSNN